jgi:hypothetical protein
MQTHLETKAPPRNWVTGIKDYRVEFQNGRYSLCNNTTVSLITLLLQHRHQPMKQQTFEIKQFLRSQRFQQALIQIGSGIVVGLLFTFMTSWQPEWKGLAGLPGKAGVMVPTMMPENLQGLAMILASGYCVGAPMGIIGAGRIMMGHYGSWVTTFVGTILATIAVIVLREPVISFSPILFLLVLLFLPPTVGMVSFNVRYQRHSSLNDEHKHHKHGKRSPR